MNAYRSWGHVPATKQVARVPAFERDAMRAFADEAPLRGRTRLPYGRGRSYGDSCLNSAGELVDTRALDRFVAFERDTGRLVAESGVTLAEILALVVPAGWFLPVSPGTSFVTLGGAVANDVHGKNHHRDGTFGRFVERFTLVRSNGERLVCSPEENAELFRATIGGLGLTGLVTEATIRLCPIDGESMDVRFDTFHGLDEFVELAAERRDTHRYTVAWLDCASGGAAFARGVFQAANHAEPLAEEGGARAPTEGSTLDVPFPLPARLLNRWTIRAFNGAYFARHRPLSGRSVRQHYRPFFYPLDTIGSWNRIYGRRGFHQYQFVVPHAARDALERILRRIVRSGTGSFLAVLKDFGDLASPGLLSFPRPGLCLALDFADRGAATTRLVGELDAMVREAGGAVYPAKDRLMSAASFAAYFPRADEFARHVDPGFSSDFWRRVRG